MFRTALLALLVFLPAASGSAKEALSYETLVTPLLSTSETIFGQPIAYPSGKAKVTAVIVTVPPGAETGWHEHAVPLFAYVLNGAITIDYRDKGSRIYKAGDSLMEPMNWPHDGVNKGTVPVRILAVYMGAEGVSNATPVAK